MVMMAQDTSDANNNATAPLHILNWPIGQISQINENDQMYFLNFLWFVLFEIYISSHMDK